MLPKWWTSRWCSRLARLQVNSTPTNASIYLNDVATGELTNFTFDNKPVGEYNVTVVKDGYDTRTETVIP